MASALLKEISDDFLTCQICLDTFKKPKSLDCLHSFCEECLKEYVKPGETQVKCPTCQRGTALDQNGVVGLKDNFFILNLVETVGARKKVQHSVDKIPCDSCAGKETVVSRCLTCNDFLCDSCVAVHKTLRAFQGHVVVTLDELQTGKYDGETEKSEPTCNVHAGEKMRFYCRTDAVPVCRDCIVLDHPKPDHEVVNLADVANELRSSSQEMVAELQQALSSTEEALTAADTTIVDIQTKGKRAQELVDEQVSHLVTIIKKLGEQCKIKAVAACAQEEKQQVAEKERLELMKVRLSSTREFTDTILSRGTDIEVACAFNQIKQCRDELCTDQEVTEEPKSPARPSGEDASREVLHSTEEWNRLLAISDCTKEGGTASMKQQKPRQTGKGKLAARGQYETQPQSPLLKNFQFYPLKDTYSKMEVDDLAVPRAPHTKRRFRNAEKALASYRLDDADSKAEDCAICMSDITDPKTLPCKDTFCTVCIDKALSYKSQCPVCGTIFGELKGNQPPGTMKVRTDHATLLPGYEDCDTIVIRYGFPSGTQGVQTQLVRMTERYGIEKEKTTQLERRVDAMEAEHAQCKQNQNQEEIVDMLKQQLQAYKEDFEEERRDRERMQARQEAMEQELTTAKATVRQLEAELHREKNQNKFPPVYHVQQNALRARSANRPTPYAVGSRFHYGYDVVDGDIATDGPADNDENKGETREERRRSRRRETDILQCPKCKREYTKDRHNELLEHIDLCYD